MRKCHQDVTKWINLIVYSAAAQSMTAMIFSSAHMQSLVVLAHNSPANLIQDGGTEHAQCPNPSLCV